MDLREKWNALTQKSYGKDLAGCTEKELYYSLLDLTKNEIAEKPLISGDKKVYYISAEFLIGKLLSNNLINLGIYADVKKIVESVGKSMAEVEEVEPEPSLGNGGLGLSLIHI